MVQIQKKEKKVTVLGVGDAGIKVVAKLSGLPEARHLNLSGMDTDTETLLASGLENTVIIDREWRNGTGCGGDVIKGQRSFSRARTVISGHISDSSLIIVTAGLGGGTATGGMPIIASEAKKSRIPAIFILSIPFVFEGHSRMRIAEDGIKELLPIADVVLPLPNDLLFSSLPSDSRVEEAFHKADIEIAKSICGVSEIIRCSNLISTGFADIKAVLGKRKSACSIGIGEAASTDGLNRCHIAVEKMLDSPFLGGPSRLKKAEAVFISLTGGKDLNIGEAKKTVETVESFTSEKAKLVIGVNTDELYGDKVRLTVICTEFDEPESVERDNEPTPSPVTRHRKIQPLIFNGDEKTSEYEQQELPLVPVSKGIFLNATPTMNNGEDLDLPTFQRKNITIDSGD